MRRRLFTILAALSLLLCAAVCALWARSYWVQDYVQYQVPKRGAGERGYREYGVRSDAGVIAVEYVDESPSPDDDAMGVLIEAEAGLRRFAMWGQIGANYADAKYRWFGIPMGYLSRHPLRTGFYSDDGPDEDLSKSYRTVWAPHWMPAALLAVLPLIVSRRRWREARRSARRRRCLCPACGYDLRASPERCPECGTTAPAATA